MSGRTRLIPKIARFKSVFLPNCRLHSSPISILPSFSLPSYRLPGQVYIEYYFISVRPKRNRNHPRAPIVQNPRTQQVRLVFMPPLSCLTPNLLLGSGPVGDHDLWHHHVRRFSLPAVLRYGTRDLASSRLRRSRRDHVRDPLSFSRRYSAAVASALVAVIVVVAKFSSA